MIYLPNDCYCSDLKVNPANWKTLKKLQKDWFIYYRFYDPVLKQKGQYVKGKLVMVKGMNHYKTVGDRRKATLQLLEDEVKKLHDAYTPILGRSRQLLIVLSLIHVLHLSRRWKW